MELFIIRSKLDKTELELIRRIKYGSINSRELLELYNEYENNYRIVFFLIQHPSFSEKTALNIIPRLYIIDLIRVIKNRRTNPFIRKRAEVEFVNKYPRYPLGEKIGYMKIAPLSLLNYFVSEKDRDVLKVILSNPQCTEELVIKMVNREDGGEGKFSFYEVMVEMEWYKRRQVAEAIAHDINAPIRIMLKIIPYLTRENLKKIYDSDKTHQSIKNGIFNFLKKRIE